MASAAAGAPPRTWVHGDEDARLPVTPDESAHEDELGETGADGLHDGQDLLRHHRQHLHLDAVELVEGASEAPRALRT